MLDPQHQYMIEKVTAFVREDVRFLGAALGGSYISGNMDEFSDLDFVLVCRDEARKAVMADRLSIISQFGPLLSAFTGEHVGEPRLIICLYEDGLLHVDFKFVTLEEFEQRVEDPIVLWEEDGLLSQTIAQTPSCWPVPDLQWIEDRFWIWIHYGVTKLGRGELFELLDHLAMIRRVVLAPMMAMAEGKTPRGVRKIETDAPGKTAVLERAVATHNTASCAEALRACVASYLELREILAGEGLCKKETAQQMVLEFLKTIAE